MNDAFLVGSIVNGDSDAVRELIARYGKALSAVLRRALPSSPDVDDVFQETWLRVVRSAHRYDPQQKFSGWLFAIAWNQVRDRWADRRPEESVELSGLVSHERTPEENALEADRAEMIRALVARLPDRLSQAVMLRYFEELSEKDVAERLGIPIGTVKSRLHNGLRKLAAAINEETT